MRASVLGTGLYTFSETGRLIQVGRRRVSAWFCGRKTGRGPVIQGEYSSLSAVPEVISFLDLIEALVVGKLREHGLSLIAIRRAYSGLGELLRTPHPFSHKNLYTDGMTVFVRVADELRNERMLDAIKRQHVFPDVILPYAARIDWGAETLLAERWRVMDGIVIDPTRRYGKPIVDAAGMPTSILWAAYRANSQDTELVADWYGVSPKEVELAVQFEDGLSRRAA